MDLKLKTTICNKNILEIKFFISIKQSVILYLLNNNNVNLKPIKLITIPPIISCK